MGPKTIMSQGVAFLLSLLLVNLLLGVLCLVAGRGERNSQALRLWGWGLILYLCGLLISITAAMYFDETERMTTAASAADLAANTLITWAPVLSVRGVLRHTRFRLSRWATGASVVAVLVVMVVNDFGPERRPEIDQAAPTVLAIVLFVAAASLLFSDLPHDARGAASLTAGASEAAESLRPVEAQRVH